MIRRTLRLAFGLTTAATLVASTWTIAQSPFATPYRERTAAELSVALDRALHQSLTPAIVEAKIADALGAGGADEAAAILRLADARGVAVTEDTRRAVQSAEEAASGWSACLACALTAEACPDLTRVAACNLPLELTPVGDVKAIMRALTAYVLGDDIDKIDLSLGVVGLGSTVAILATGGSSATVKAGATALRLARKTGTISAGLLGELTTLARASLRLDRAGDVLRGAARPADLLDGVAATRLASAASDMGRLTAALPAGDAFALLKHAESTGDLARIARVAETAGTEARGSFAILGATRALRLTHRLAELSLIALALLAAVLGQVLTIVLWLIRARLRPKPFQTDLGDV